MFRLAWYIEAITVFGTSVTNCHARFSCHMHGGRLGRYFTLQGEDEEMHAWLMRLSVLRRWLAAPGFSAGCTVTSSSRWMWWCAPPASSTCVLSASTGECTCGYYEDGREHFFPLLMSGWVFLRYFDAVCLQYYCRKNHKRILFESLSKMQNLLLHDLFT